MAANTTIYGVQIILDRAYTTDPDIGLYDYDYTVHCFSWSEAYLTGVSEAWTAGILLKDGIGDIEESSDLSRGGNVAEYSGLTIAVANAESLMQSLKDLQINLMGFSAIVTEFIGTIADSDATSRTVQFTGVVEDIKWGDTTLTIALKNSAYKRETNLSSTNADGVTTPVCFGKLTPPLTKIVDGVSVASTDINNLAKFVRTLDSYDEETYKDTFFTGVASSISTFPIYAVYVDHISYGCIATQDVVFDRTIPEDTYVIVVSGDGEGQIRQVTEFIPISGTDPYFQFYIKGVFATELSSTSGDDRSWVKFVKIGRNYKSDSIACKDFIKAADGTAIDIPELYTYDSDNDKYARIADFGFTVKDTNNNELEIDGQQYSDNIDTLDSISIKPVSSVYASTEASLALWNYGTETWWGFGYPKISDGLYGQIDHISGVFADGSKVYDKDSTTYATYDLTYNQDSSIGSFFKVINFDIPTQPEGFDWDKVYIAVKLNTKSNRAEAINPGESSFRIMLRTWGGYRRYTNLEDKPLNENYATGGVVDCFPDRYWSDAVDTNDLNYYRESGVSTSQITGLTYFEISGATKENYSALALGGLFFFRACAYTLSGTDTLKLYEIAFIFKKNSSDIKKEIYSPLSARVYGDTWESRKTAADLIEKPVDVIEHIKRLQNWSEFTTTAYNWGHEYAYTNPTYYDKIRITGEGSFDSTNLNYLTGQKVAMEIEDKDKATSSSLVKKLCDTFGVCTYIDREGYECIETLELTSPSETITLADQIGAIGDIEEPRVENIFCQPVVNYCLNQGSGEYDRTLKVTNIDATAWAAAYTPGFTLADGEIVWNSCKVLYNQFRQIETCPSEFSDQCCIADYATAVYYIKRKIAWMGKMRLPTITVAYSKGKDYNIYKHLMVQFPMHTNNVSVECIIEKITKSKNTNTVKIDCVILGDVEDAWYDTSDSTNVKQDTPTLTDPAVIDQ